MSSCATPGFRGLGGRLASVGAGARSASSRGGTRTLAGRRKKPKPAPFVSLSACRAPHVVTSSSSIRRRSPPRALAPKPHCCRSAVTPVVLLLHHRSSWQLRPRRASATHNLSRPCHTTVCRTYAARGLCPRAPVLRADQDFDLLLGPPRLGLLQLRTQVGVLLQTGGGGVPVRR